MSPERHTRSNDIAARAAVELGTLAESEGRSDVQGGLYPDAQSPASGELTLTAQFRGTCGELGSAQHGERVAIEAEIDETESALRHDTPSRDDEDAKFSTAQWAAFGTIAVLALALAAIDIKVLAPLVDVMFDWAPDGGDATIEGYALATIPAVVALACAHLAVERWAESRLARGARVRRRGRMAALLCGVVVVGVGTFGTYVRLNTADVDAAAATSTGQAAFVLFQCIFSVGTFVAAVLVRAVQRRWRKRFEKRLGTLRHELGTAPATFGLQDDLVRHAFASAVTTYRTTIERETLDAAGRVAWQRRNATDLSDSRLLHQLAPDVFPPPGGGPAPTPGPPPGPVRTPPAGPSRPAPVGSDDPPSGVPGPVPEPAPAPATAADGPGGNGVGPNPTPDLGDLAGATSAWPGPTPASTPRGPTRTAPNPGPAAAPDPDPFDDLIFGDHSSSTQGANEWN